MMYDDDGISNADADVAFFADLLATTAFLSEISLDIAILVFVVIILAMALAVVALVALKLMIFFVGIMVVYHLYRSIGRHALLFAFVLD